MRVMHICETLGLGGAERFLLSLLRHVDRNKYEPIVCFIPRGEKGYRCLIEEVDKLGVRRFILPMKNSADIRIVFRLARLLRQEKIDLVHTHLAVAHFYGRLAALCARVPAIIVSEQNVYKRKAEIPFSWVEKFLLLFTDKIITCSEAVKDFLINEVRLAADKVETVHNPVNLTKFNYHIDGKKARDKFGIDSHSMIVGTIGYLYPQKGQRYLLEAAARIIPHRAEVHFMFVGEGPLHNELMLLAEELSIADKVIFVGFQREVAETLAAFDLFVLPSLWEGMGIVLLEAMALCKPVVATRTGGIPEVVKETVTGYLVPPGDVSALAERIKLLLDDASLRERMGQAGRRRVEQYFSEEKISRQVEEIYEQYRSINSNYYIKGHK